MKNNIKKHIRPLRFNSLPEIMRQSIKAARLERGMSQAELGKRVGLPQMHISNIENGKTIPRVNTLVDLVRVLDYDLLLVPRSLVPAVQSLVRDHHQNGNEEHSLYSGDEQADDEGPHDEV